MRIAIFTDLDGSLLDHHDYSWSGARPALERILRAGIPLVFVTSKTRAEVEALQTDMQVEEPFIVENGGGIFFPERYSELRVDGAEPAGAGRVVVLGRRYAEIRSFLAPVGRELGVRGFGDLTLDEVVEQTGLPPETATLARQRDFTEPFTLESDDRLPELTARAEAAGLAIVRGGRFWHLIGAGQDKGVAVERVRDVLRDNADAGCGPTVTVGIGDSPNDLPLLSVVDVPVVIPNPQRGRLDPGRPDAVHASRPGSSGWNDALISVLDRLEQSTVH